MPRIAAGKSGFAWTPEQMARHLDQIATSILPIRGLEFTKAAADESKDVFFKSFSMKRFNDTGSAKWAELSEETKRKRRKYGTINRGILTDTYSLRNSLSVKYGNLSTPMSLMSEVYTEKYRFLKSHTNPSRKPFCYAAIHNMGINDRYNFKTGANDGVIPKRQFMGYSRIARNKQRRLVSYYLFERVFMSQSAFMFPISDKGIAGLPGKGRKALDLLKNNSNFIDI